MGLGEWEWIGWCEGVGKLGCFWKMNGNVVDAIVTGKQIGRAHV